MDDWKVLPALASKETLSDEQAEAYLMDESYHAEQKFDGERLVIHCHQGRIIGINRKGNITLVPENVAEAFQWFDGEWVFDGELIKRHYHVFDMPRALEVSRPEFPYSIRRSLLESLWPSLAMDESCVALARTETSEEGKRALVAGVRESRGEGVVFKQGNAPYRPGPTRTAEWRKWKFVKQLDCIVMELGIDGKRNFSVGLVDEETGELREVTIVSALTGDGAKVQPLDVVEVTFLYASEDFRLVQPTLPRLRPDKSPHECVFSDIYQYVTNKEVVT